MVYQKLTTLKVENNMSLIITKIKEDLDSSRRSKDTKTLTILTTLYAECAMVGKNKRNGDPTDEETISVIRKFKLNLTELQQAKNQPMEDISFELSLYDKYLPSALTIDELKAIIDQYVNDIPEVSPKYMGSVMKKLKQEYMGRYDGLTASQLTKQLLSKE